MKNKPTIEDVIKAYTEIILRIPNPDFEKTRIFKVKNSDKFNELTTKVNAPHLIFAFTQLEFPLIKEMTMEEYFKIITIQDAIDYFEKYSVKENKEE